MNGGLDRLANRGDVRARLEAGGLSAAAADAKAALLARCAEALAAGGAARDAATTAFFVPGRIEVLGKHTDYAGGRSLIAAAEQGICLVAAAREDATIRAMALDMATKRSETKGSETQGSGALSVEAPDPASFKAATVEFPLSPDLLPAVGHWSNYLATVGRRLARNFPGASRGADIAFAGDLPVAAGMSGSSALVVACFLALAAVNRLREREEFHGNVATPEDLAEYLGAVENGQTFRGLAGDKGVGTFGGSEDHTAMLCSKVGMLAQYAYCPMRLERRLPMPAGYVFAIASSGVAAEKTGEAMEKYNHASRLAAEVARVWREATGRNDPHIAAALASSSPATSAERMRAVLAGATDGSATQEGSGALSVEAPDPFSVARASDGVGSGALTDRAPDPLAFTSAVMRGGSGDPPRTIILSPAAHNQDLLTRFEHFFGESEEIVPAAGDALAVGDLPAFGRLVDLSQKLAEGYLGNQVPETVLLTRAARELGAVAASAFGAGFGGSVWALVRRDEAERFLAAWSARYREAFPSRAASASFFLSGAGPAAIELA